MQTIFLELSSREVEAIPPGDYRAPAWRVELVKIVKAGEYTLYCWRADSLMRHTTPSSYVEGMRAACAAVRFYIYEEGP